ncbi:MAG TPA: MFS transporter [Actinomycetes bacterium]|nr:MFS transporter [Actinomycetes bacterium]
MAVNRTASRVERRGGSDAWVLALVCLAQFMVVLDVSIVNVALPSIRDDLHFSQTGLQWVVNAYTLAFAGFLLLGGRAADLYGRRRIFLLGIGLFTAASLAGGLAQNQSMLIAARTAQGLGGAILSPATLTILTTTFTDRRRRSRALGMWSAVAGAGGAAGSLLGGVLTDLAGWRWILFINVPIGLLGLLAARVLLVETRRGRAPSTLDTPGAVLVTGGLMALVYAIVGTSQHAWTSTRTLATLGVAVVLLGWFLYHEARIARHPLMPLGLFRSGSVRGANLVMLCMGGGFFAFWFFLSLYMQNVLGYSPLVAGFAFLPSTLGIIVGAQVGSRLLPRVGVRPLLVPGAAMATGALLWLGRVTPDGSYVATLLGPTVLGPLGLGLAFTPIAFAATAGVPADQAGLASGLVNTTRQVGGSIGLAALATVATNRTTALLGAAPPASALTSGYARAFLASAAILVLGALAALVLPSAPRTPRTPAPAQSSEAVRRDATPPAGRGGSLPPPAALNPHLRHAEGGASRAERGSPLD